MIEEYTRAQLVGYTQPAKNFEGEFEDVKDLIAFCARVSNPSNQFNNETADKLIAYLLKHKHFSPFEMASATLEVETTRDIARQLLRHRSFTFQEFCVTGDSKITTLTKGGKPKRVAIADLYSRYQSKQYWDMADNLVRVYDEATGVLKPAKIKEVFSTGVKPVYALTIENGKMIKSTQDHKFLTKDGFKRLADISVNDFIGCNGIPVYQDKDWLAAAKVRSIENATGVQGIANEAGVSYHTIRKWLKINGIQFTKAEVAMYTEAWNKGLPTDQQPRYGKIHSESTRKKQHESSRKGTDSEFYQSGRQRTFAYEVRDHWYKQKNALYKECGGVCEITGQVVPYKDMEIDHLLPVVKHPELAYTRSNIRLIHKDEHLKKSAEESKKRLETVSWHKVQSVEYVGEEQTYDMEIDHESHNYVANGIVTHNSQRYADPVKDLSFVIRETRMQDQKNRQSSLEINREDEEERFIDCEWKRKQQEVIDLVTEHYKWAVGCGIAKEQARSILPEGNTKSRLYVQGTIRSFIHYIEVRQDISTQKEHRVLVLAVAKAIAEIFPLAQ